MLVPDVRTVYVVGLFTVVIVCLVILAIPNVEPTDRTAVTAIGSAAMGNLSGVLWRMPERRNGSLPD